MAERESDPGAMLADKGYDSDPVRQDLRDRGATPEIPTKRSRKTQYTVNKRLYALRARIECFFNKLKNHRRIATRYDQTSTSFLGFVLLGCIASGSGLSTRPSHGWPAQLWRRSTCRSAHARRRTSRYLNTRADNSRRPARRRERQMQRFKPSGQAQNFLRRTA